MFFRDRASNTSSRQKLKGPVSLISPDLTVSGNLSTQGDLQIDGTVEGDIQCQSLTIGANAKVIGQISALEVLIRGSLIGNIQAQTVTLTKTAQVSGDIKHQTIAIESGARLDGRVSNSQNRSLASSEHAMFTDSLEADKLDQIQRIRRQIK